MARAIRGDLRDGHWEHETNACHGRNKSMEYYVVEITFYGARRAGVASCPDGAVSAPFSILPLPYPSYKIFPSLQEAMLPSCLLVSLASPARPGITDSGPCLHARPRCIFVLSVMVVDRWNVSFIRFVFIDDCFTRLISHLFMPDCLVIRLPHLCSLNSRTSLPPFIFHCRLIV